ncbi:hypothetical protein JW826_05040 [Candidatus Woesearchaeota archaeon]|nr:hypothetical protein [Candidatus Woesearchaeota archaeon]
MVDSIVSIRMPSSLVHELKSLSKENHFLDVSEELRSIIKIKTREYKLKISDGQNITEEREEKIVEKQVDFKTENIVKEELVKRLKEMIRQLEKNHKER